MESDEDNRKLTQTHLDKYTKQVAAPDSLLKDSNDESLSDSSIADIPNIEETT